MDSDVDNRRISRRSMWLLLVSATVSLVVSALLFDDGAILRPDNLGRLVLGTVLLTLGGAMATLAVLEAWRPVQRITTRLQDPPPDRRGRPATPRADASPASRSAQS